MTEEFTDFKETHTEVCVSSWPLTRCLTLFPPVLSFFSSFVSSSLSLSFSRSVGPFRPQLFHTLTSGSGSGDAAFEHHEAAFSLTASRGRCACEKTTSHLIYGVSEQFSDERVVSSFVDSEVKLTSIIIPTKTLNVSALLD